MASPTSPLHFFLFFSSLIAASSATGTIPNTTATTSSCPLYRCGHAVDIRYPFWIDDDTNAANASHCGYPSLRLECRRDTPVLPLPSGDYAVTHILYGDRTVSLFDLGVFSRSNTCPLVGRNLTLPEGSPLSLTARDTNLTFFIHCSFMGIPTHLVACLEGDGLHHSYVFRDGDDRMPYGYAGLCQDVVGMPVLRRSLLGLGGTAGTAGPLDAVVPALNMGFELRWRPEAEVGGECGGCEKAGGWCGHRREAAHEPWTFTCFRTATTYAWVAPKSPAAMLLLTLLVLAASSTTRALNTTSSSCEPASCGDLRVAYPFWLGGRHPPECGYHAFQVTCDSKGKASLTNSFWTYQVLDISYANSSFRITNVELSEGTCDVELHVNASSDLGLAPFAISPANQELFFLYNRTQARPPPPSWALVTCANGSLDSFAWLARRYKPDDIWRPLPGNCTVSMMPVFGYEGVAGEDYERLMKGGFLLEYKADDCTACMGSGGRCRTNVSYDEFECHCSNGVSPLIICDAVKDEQNIDHVRKLVI